MESKEKIIPHKITKPIQLLAAWLSGLILVNTSFLITATQIINPLWLSAALVIASIVNVPLFLIAIFLLQTRFRPEMQEDTFYSKYLESVTGNSVREVNIESIAKLREDFAKFEKIVSEKVVGIQTQSLSVLNWSNVKISLNKKLLNYKDVANILSENDIPIHELFGGNASIPELPFKIAIGSGFTIDQIKSIVEVISKVTDGWISFAHEEPDSDYSDMVLIGAYGSYQHGLTFNQLKPIIDRKNINIHEIYKVLGK